MAEYLNLMNVADNFSAALENLARHANESEQNDPVTGLKNKAAMKNDMAKEMERLKRQGAAFVFVLLRLDSMKNSNESIKKVADFLSGRMRLLDDAYSLGKGEFVLCFRLTDLTSGMQGLERLRQEFEKHEASNRGQVSFSACVAEPLAGDDLGELLENLRADLDEDSKDQGVILQYVEVSPLQRYLREQQTA